jgi:hypothetical protein
MAAQLVEAPFHRSQRDRLLGGLSVPENVDR